MPLDVNNESVKDALKEGLTEWLDDKFAELGKWTLRGILAAALAGLVWLTLVSNGWAHRP